MTNPFTTVFTDTVDWDDPFSEKVDNQLSTEMITVPREEWEWRERLINFQYKVYFELLEECDRLREMVKTSHVELEVE